MGMTHLKIKFKCDTSLPKTSESLQIESTRLTPCGETILEERTRQDLEAKEY